jgi:hypothetical protein
VLQLQTAILQALFVASFLSSSAATAGSGVERPLYPRKRG